MRNPLSAFARWRLTSDIWFYWMLTFGVGCFAAGLAVAAGLLVRLLTWAAAPSGEPWLWWQPWLCAGLFGLGAFVLIFEVGLVDLMLSAQKGLRQRRLEGDDDLYEEMLRWQKRRKEAKEKWK